MSGSHAALKRNVIIMIHVLLLSIYDVHANTHSVCLAYHGYFQSYGIFSAFCDITEMEHTYLIILLKYKHISFKYVRAENSTSDLNMLFRIKNKKQKQKTKTKKQKQKNKNKKKTDK